MQLKSVLLLAICIVAALMVVAPAAAAESSKDKYLGPGVAVVIIYYEDGTQEFFFGPVEWRATSWFSDGISLKQVWFGDADLTGYDSGAVFRGKMKWIFHVVNDQMIGQVQLIGTVFFADGTSRKYHSEFKQVGDTETVDFFKWV
jgi:hypothetical protein